MRDVFLRAEHLPLRHPGEKFKVMSSCLALFRDVIASYRLFYPPPPDAVPVDTGDAARSFGFDVVATATGTRVGNAVPPCFDLPSRTLGGFCLCGCSWVSTVPSRA